MKNINLKGGLNVSAVLQRLPVYNVAEGFTICQGQMKIVSFIEEPPVIKQILQHLDLWEIPPQVSLRLT